MSGASKLRRSLASRSYAGYIGAAAALIVVLAVIVPVGMVAITSFRTSPVGTPGHFTASNYHSVVADPTAAHLLANTVIYALGSATLAMILASLFAWTVTRVSVPARRVLRVLPLLSLAAPNLLKDIAWIQLYGPRSGLINLAIEHIFHARSSPLNLYSMPGLIIVTAVYVVPIAYLILLVPFESLDVSLEEASYIAGVSRWRTQIAINARVLMPALLSAYVLTLIVVAGTFEAPLLIGLPAGISTYMSEIYRSLTAAVPNFELASAQAAWYLCLTFVLFCVYLRATRREQRFVTVTGRGSQRTAHSARVVRFGLVAFLLFDFLVAFVLPIALALITLFVPIYQLQAGHFFQGAWNFHIISSVLGTAINRQAILSSVELAFVVAAIAVLAGALLSFVALRTKVRGRRVAEFIGMLPISMPGMVISVAILITFLGLQPLHHFYNTVVPMVIVDSLVALPFTMRIFAAALIQIDGDLISASLVCGGGTLRTLRQILVPLTRKAALNALVISFMIAFRELGAIVLIVPTSHNFIPPLAWIYWNSGEFDPVAVLNAVTLQTPLAIAGALLTIVRLGRTVKRLAFGGPNTFEVYSAGQLEGEHVGISA